MTASCSFAWQVLQISRSLPTSPAANDEVTVGGVGGGKRRREKEREGTSRDRGGGKMEGRMKMGDKEGGRKNEGGR